MTPFIPRLDPDQTFISEFDAVPFPASHDLAALLPEMVAESLTVLGGYVAGLLTAPEYVLLDVLGGAPVLDGVTQPLPRALLRQLPDADATVESLLAMGLVRVTAETVQLAPGAVQIVADSVTEALR